MNDYRPLTRREQLEWLLNFYKKQRELLDIHEKEVQKEYKLILKKESEKNE